MVKEWLVEYITDSCRYAQFCKVEKTEQVLESARKAYKIGSKSIEEYLSRKER